MSAEFEAAFEAVEADRREEVEAVEAVEADRREEVEAVEAVEAEWSAHPNVVLRLDS